MILLDVLLPQLNGMEVLRRVRKHKDVPVIMVTARDAVMDKVAGLDAGADDYLTKPFAIEELFARIRVALKRSEAVRAASGVGGIGDGRGRRHGCRRHCDAPGQSTRPRFPPRSPPPRSPWARLRSTPTAAKSRSAARPLRSRPASSTSSPCLWRMPSTVLTRERIAHEALGYEYMGDTNNVDVHIAHLRAKIEDAGGVRIIQTVRGVGYVCRA